MDVISFLSLSRIIIEKSSVHVDGGKKKCHLLPRDCGITGPCCYRWHCGCGCEPGCILPAECAGVSYQCTPGIIPYAFGSRNRNDNRSNINHCHNHRQHRITLAGVSQQHDEPVRRNKGWVAVRDWILPPTEAEVMKKIPENVKIVSTIKTIPAFLTGTIKKAIKDNSSFILHPM